MVRTEAKVKRFNKLHQDAELGILYQVEEILDRKICRGKIYYLIKWVGYSTDSNTWEKARNLALCPEALARFEDSVAPISPESIHNNNEEPPQVRNSPAAAGRRRHHKRTKKMKNNSGQS